MKRKIEEKILEWKQQSNGRTALLIDGARRVGKSYIAEAFAKQNYKSYILIDFNKASDDIKTLFDEDLDDLDRLFMLLSAAYNTKLYERESLIIFDEVQLYPRARAAIKFLVSDGRYDYMETGSLMSIKKNVENILIPSEERHIKMYPMDFEEFLWAKGEEMVMPVIKNSFENKKPLGQALHRKIITLFREYVIIGGMPQVVEEYTKTGDFEAADLIKRDIISLYREDIQKHAKGYESKVESIFDEIPSQLSKHEKRFTLSSLGKGARFRDYESAFLWLQDSMIANICFNSTEPNLGLKLNRDNSSFKIYMGDTGLLISHAFDENGIVSEDIYKKLLFGKLEVNEGMIFENVVAQMLATNGKKLYFYSNPSRDDKDSRMEIDFLLAKSKITNRHNISPIEVKSGKNYTLSSLNKFKKKYNEQLNVAYVLHVNDLKEEGGIVYLPVYMTGLL
ncbi:MAG: AAA family ATPase [Butyrivibrio sp.]|uniref:ATP-binding protein n=1 Tax=Butyrivibrio sp. TaxID=28121 RepID=UPI0025D91CD3|nr:AAA family ATPase [Butyrivibrio sp.]MCR5772694.1 AAA family ATPase [Butyrivibrio sp.]